MTYHQVMAVEGRQKFDEQAELQHKAAEERLSEDMENVVVIRESDERLRKQAEAAQEQQ